MPSIQERVEVLGLVGEVPAAWERVDPSSSMRLAQFRVPAQGGGEAGEFIVFFFGPGQGGSVEANVERWRGQFQRPDGGAVEPRVTEFEANGVPVTLAELTGTYTRGVGMGQAGPAEPDRTLLAAVVETERGSAFVQLHGPAATVASWRDAFVSFLRGLSTAG